MSVTRRDFNTREEWLANRVHGIGGSEIAAVIGQNPWCNNVELWEYKTGRRTRPNVSNEEAVRYGIRAEHLIRELYELDHPNNTVYYTEFNSWSNDRYPWALASLDGWILDDIGRLGVLEIKTSEVRNASDWNKWTESIPQNYFCQCLYYMAVTEADFADLRAHIRYMKNGEIRATIRDYHIERTDVFEDIKYLMDAGAKFWEQVQKEERPGLILPDII